MNADTTCWHYPGQSPQTQRPNHPCFNVRAQSDSGWHHTRTRAENAVISYMNVLNSVRFLNLLVTMRRSIYLRFISGVIISVSVIFFLAEFSIDHQRIKDAILKRQPVIYSYLLSKMPDDSARDGSLVTNPGRNSNMTCGIFVNKKWTVSPQRRYREDVIRRSRIPAPKSDVKCPPELHFFQNGTLPKTALASFPGSGNTWTRHLLQVATGNDRFILPK